MLTPLSEHTRDVPCPYLELLLRQTFEGDRVQGDQDLSAGGTKANP